MPLPGRTTVVLNDNGALRPHRWGSCGTPRKERRVGTPRGQALENMGFTYIGPVDGLLITDTSRFYGEPRQLDPLLLAVLRGPGYPPAEG